MYKKTFAFILMIFNAFFTLQINATTKTGRNVLNIVLDQSYSPDREDEDDETTAEPEDSSSWSKDTALTVGITLATAAVGTAAYLYHTSQAQTATQITAPTQPVVQGITSDLIPTETAIQQTLDRLLCPLITWLKQPMLTPAQSLTQNDNQPYWDKILEFCDTELITPEERAATIKWLKTKIDDYKAIVAEGQKQKELAEAMAKLEEDKNYSEVSKQALIGFLDSVGLQLITPEERAARIEWLKSLPHTAFQEFYQLTKNNPSDEETIENLKRLGVISSDIDASNSQPELPSSTSTQTQLTLPKTDTDSTTPNISPSESIMPQNLTTKSEDLNVSPSTTTEMPQNPTTKSEDLDVSPSTTTENQPNEQQVSKATDTHESTQSSNNDDDDDNSESY